jgi:hypothetical protein
MKYSAPYDGTVTIYDEIYMIETETTLKNLRLSQLSPTDIHERYANLVHYFRLKF